MNSLQEIDLENILSEKFGKNVSVESASPIGEGCINETARVKTNHGLFFAKWNDAKQFPKMLEAEARGLRLLQATGEIKVPDVVAQKTISDKQYLVLEFIEGNATGRNFWNDFGKSLAKLHKYTAKQFGLDHDNYIGSLYQSNRQHDKWSEFFILERLEPQIKLALDNGRINHSISYKFSKLFTHLEKIFPTEKPSLLHGDLWSGNYMIGINGEPVIVDPAVYFGHREMDLGMTKLFGGFTSEFYQSYNEEFPLENDWYERIEICNLYPLMVHVNIFGGSYKIKVEDILKRF